MSHHSSNLPVEAAVRSSPLFSLPLELRNMIYNHLLSRKQRILIAEGQFDQPRSPFARPKCKIAFDHQHRLWFHGMVSCCRPNRDSPLFPSILQTCRLVHAETSHILYQSNKLHFGEKSVLERFGQCADQKQTKTLKEIHLTDHFSYAYLFWTSYFTTSFPNDFPNLKRIYLTSHEGRPGWGRGPIMHCNEDVKPDEVYRLLISFVKSFNSLETIGLKVWCRDDLTGAALGAFEMLKEASNAAESSRNITIELTVMPTLHKQILSIPAPRQEEHTKTGQLPNSGPAKLDNFYNV